MELAAKALLQTLAKRYLLAVLDGSKALEKALREVFPKTLIQRCLVHKERNLKGYLSSPALVGGQRSVQEASQVPGSRGR